ncbi:MAG: Gfo/Idh/MocA family oxidoreductase [Desulfatiglandales bacterium]
MVKQKKIRAGVIGVGHLGEFHLQKYAALPEVELVGVVDIDRDRAEDIARRYDTRSFENHQDLLERVDGVSLAVPTEAHFALSMAILDKGVHLLVEKPITHRLEDADRMIALARERNLVLQVGHVERFNPAVVKMNALLDRPIFIESHRLSPFTARGLDVDVVLDLMIHDLDIIFHAVQSPVRELHAVGMTVITQKTDIANVRIIFENGTVANLTASRVSNASIRKIRIFQQDAYLSADCLKREVSITRLDSPSEEEGSFPQIASEKLRYPDSDPLADQIRAFVHALMSRSEPIVSGDDGRKALNAALAINEQIERGCRNFQAIR